jgi:hypothetical protein
MCAEDNMQVANCTTPANYFHILRRQLKREIRKPLILMTPKSLLRHKRAMSRLDELTNDTSFHRLLWDDAQLLPNEKIKLVADEKIRRVVMCSGKVYYDLYEEREKRGISEIYILRLEQLYPFLTKALVTELSRFKQAEMVWSQEERPIWAPGSLSTSSCNGFSTRSAPSTAPCATQDVRRRHRPQSGKCRSIRSSSNSSSMRRWDRLAGYHDRAWRMRGKAKHG